MKKITLFLLMILTISFLVVTPSMAGKLSSGQVVAICSTGDRVFPVNSELGFQIFKMDPDQYEWLLVDTVDYMKVVASGTAMVQEVFYTGYTIQPAVAGHSFILQVRNLATGYTTHDSFKVAR